MAQKLRKQEFNRLYHCPTDTFQGYKKPLGIIDREKKANYLTVTSEESNGLTKIFTNKRSITPSSAKYGHIKDWKKEGKGITCPKAKKITVMDEIFAKAKKAKSPGPHSYKPIIKDEPTFYRWTKDHQLKMFAEV